MTSLAALMQPEEDRSDDRLKMSRWWIFGWHDRSKTFYVGRSAFRLHTWLSREMPKPDRPAQRAFGRSIAVYMDVPHFALRASVYLRRVERER